MIAHDLTLLLPVASNSVRFIYSEHFIEHIPHEAAAQLLRECHRVLRPDGVVRMSTPNLRKLISEYESGRLDEWINVGWRPETPCRLLNEGLRKWDHQFVYDEAELLDLVRAAGFQDCRLVEWRVSSHPELHELETRPFHDEVIFEAVKRA